MVVTAASSRKFKSDLRYEIRQLCLYRRWGMHNIMSVIRSLSNALVCFAPSCQTLTCTASSRPISRSDQEVSPTDISSRS
jgi:hypothetical protein